MSTAAVAAEEESGSDRLWEVVGGVDTGGIVVRTDRPLASQKLDERLATGALVRELTLDAGRLQYRLLDGSGPPTGWVSLRISSKALLVERMPSAGRQSPDTAGCEGACSASSSSSASSSAPASAGRRGGAAERCAEGSGQDDETALGSLGSTGSGPTSSEAPDVAGPPAAEAAAEAAAAAAAAAPAPAADARAGAAAAAAALSAAPVASAAP
eukprot:CAMPEP_0183461290 /NCGR_PEP_ID=MMETSP0370-20130417/139369_1 /TAXON_ID=268820 /ORGANISM="Peridinium aciculiferum, Strain PAER-2" /LENGTH=212 /DNA_ID=CAMNT_0025653245 /DNA_START=38 /DNA_END=673 /DNA_ORIENTATION=+